MTKSSTTPAYSLFAIGYEGALAPLEFEPWMLQHNTSGRMFTGSNYRHDWGYALDMEQEGVQISVHDALRKAWQLNTQKLCFTPVKLTQTSGFTSRTLASILAITCPDVPRNKTSSFAARLFRINASYQNFDRHSEQLFQYTRLHNRDLAMQVKACIKKPRENAAKLLDALNYVSHETATRVLHRLQWMEVETGVTKTSCGHFEEEENVINMYNGDILCQGCEDHTVCVDEAMYYRTSCYYWESDNEWHLEEEEEEEEEEDYVDTSGINSWSASTACLSHDTTFTPSPHGDFTLGVELEVECVEPREHRDAVQSTLSSFDRDYGYIMLKTDGSLSDHGFEIVTAARKLKDHTQAFAAWAPHDALRAWQPGTCGVHVHIDSRAFTQLTLGKFLMFINATQNKALIKSIAGRHPDDGGAAQSYAAALGQEVLATPAKALKSGHHSRYRMVNMVNIDYAEQKRLGVNVSRDCKGKYSTVELRIFRASLKKERLLAQIEFSHAAVMFCRTASWGALDGFAFRAWLLANAGGYKNLAHWFGINVPKENKREDTRIRTTTTTTTNESLFA